MHDKKLSAARKYALLSTGTTRLGQLIRYELITFFSGSMPGAIGYALRRLLLPSLLRGCGKGLSVGRNVVLRGGSRISLGKDVVIDDGCVLDARGPDAEIEIGDGVLVSRNTIIRSRGQKIRIGAGTDIGCNCILGTDSTLDIGENVLIAAYSYIIAGGNHKYSERTRPIIEQGFEQSKGVRVGDGVWLGARTTVMDGAEIGEGAIIGAHALVKGHIPAYAIAFGTPAKIHARRPASQDSNDE